MKVVVIQGSARSIGHSSQIVELLKEELELDVIDLNMKNIHPFHYEHIHSDDDFLPLMKKISEYDRLIFVTPVYWYSMSGIMKNFFDRITDCLIVEKELGRKLRGKSMGAISCGSDDSQTLGFFEPFRKSAEYLGMQYIGDVHTWIDREKPSDHNRAIIESFIENL